MYSNHTTRRWTQISNNYRSKPSLCRRAKGNIPPWSVMFMFCYIHISNQISYNWSFSTSVTVNVCNHNPYIYIYLYMHTFYIKFLSLVINGLRELRDEKKSSVTQPGIHFRKQTSRHRWYLFAGSQYSKKGGFTRIWRLDSGPNLSQPWICLWLIFVLYIFPQEWLTFLTGRCGTFGRNGTFSIRARVRWADHRWQPRCFPFRDGDGCGCGWEEFPEKYWIDGSLCVNFFHKNGSLADLDNFVGCYYYFFRS